MRGLGVECASQDSSVLSMLGCKCSSPVIDPHLPKLLGCKGLLTVWFRARTASLCSHKDCSARNSTQRIGTLRLAAKSTHLLRTSLSALVLSASLQPQRRELH